MKFKLSICIATHNRAVFLDETLASLFPQLSDNVEVVVIDGNSTDNTKDIVNKYSIFNDNIKYIFLEKKGGVDCDFNISIEKANGEYCWLFSDDDFFKPNAISTILSYLNENNYSALIINAELCDLKMKKIFKQKALNIQVNRVYNTTIKDQRLLFSELGSYLSFIGCLVINRTLWLNRNKEMYFGTEFIHVGVLFQDFLPSKTLFLHKPLISIRLGNAQWTNRAFNIWLKKWPNLIWSFENFNSNSKKIIVKKFPLSQYSKLIYFRVLGVYNYSQFKEFKNDISHPIINLFIALIIVIMNKKVLKYILYLYAKLMKREWIINEIKNA